MLSIFPLLHLHTHWLLFISLLLTYFKPLSSLTLKNIITWGKKPYWFFTGLSASSISPSKWVLFPITSSVLLHTLFYVLMVTNLDNWPLNKSLHPKNYLYLMIFQDSLPMFPQNLPFLLTSTLSFNIGGYSIYLKFSCLLPLLFIFWLFCLFLFFFTSQSHRKLTPSWWGPWLSYSLLYSKQTS